MKSLCTFSMHFGMSLAANFKLFTILSVASNVCLFATYWMKFSASVHWNQDLCKPPANRLVFVVTPTYQRTMQMASMTNLMQTLRLVPPPIHWIVIEDNEEKSDKIKRLLKRSGLQHTHLAFISPVRNLDPYVWDTKAARQRSYALHYIRLRFAHETDALIYFADDDNIYDVRLFDLIRQVKGLGIWPVAFSGNLVLQKPLVDKGVIVGWDTIYQIHRPYATDNAGYAFSVELLLKSTESIHFISHFYPNFRMYDEESGFLEQLNITLDKAEPLGIRYDRSPNEVLIWHIRQTAHSIHAESDYVETFNKSSDDGWIV